MTRAPVAPGILHLIATALLGLVLAVTLAGSGVFQPPVGGWDIDRPLAVPTR